MESAREHAPATVPAEAFADAHWQLVARDKELMLLQHQLLTLAKSRAGNVAEGSAAVVSQASHDSLVRSLNAALEQQTVWCQRLTDEVAKRDDIIVELQGMLNEQTEWARRSASEVVKRDDIIAQLQQSLSEQTEWARRSAEEVTLRESLVHELQTSVSDLQTALIQQKEAAQKLADQIARRNWLPWRR
jgi:hypothetical protein